MDNMLNDIAHFHTKFKLDYKGKPRLLPEELAEFRKQFLFEETIEYADASATDDLEEMLDALVDLVYVALGTAHLHGFDFEEAWQRVHYCNMQKVRARFDHESKRDTHYDVVKPEGWLPPDLSDLVS